MSEFSKLERFFLWLALVCVFWGEPSFACFCVFVAYLVYRYQNR